ncbi:9027_t:CDS:1, partial [Scutellospora calospora]
MINNLYSEFNIKQNDKDIQDDKIFQKSLSIEFNNSFNDKFILDLFYYFYDLYNSHFMTGYVANMLKQYFKDNKVDPIEVFNHLIHYKNQSYFTSMIGYLYQFGI